MIEKTTDVVDGEALPPPPVPANAVLGPKFTTYPLELDLLRKSSFNAHASDAGWRAAVNLWGSAFQRSPAGSLPDDDLELCRLADLGTDIKKWLKVKREALWKWRKCSDGRYYHDVVAEKVLAGWIGKLSYSKASEAGNAKRYGNPFDPSHYDDAIESAIAMLRTLNGQSTYLTKATRMFRKTKGCPQPRVDKPAPIGRRSGARREDGGTPELFPSGSQMKSEEGRENNILPKATPLAPAAAGASGEPVGETPDLKVWRAGLAILLRTTTRSEDKLRSLIGKWRSRVDDDTLFEFIVQSERRGMTQPISWIEQQIRDRHRAPSALEARQQSAVAWQVRRQGLLRVVEGGGEPGGAVIEGELSYGP